jgi:hypothetical protein
MKDAQYLVMAFILAAAFFGMIGYIIVTDTQARMRCGELGGAYLAGACIKGEIISLNPAEGG